MIARPMIAAAGLLAFATLPAKPASSEWSEVEGGAVRVVVSSVPDAAGKLRGALQIDLEPGWKTYWLEPGGSGVPPSVEVTAGGKPVNSEVGFPAPRRHGDGSDIWAGYDHPVSLALTMEPPQGTHELDFSVFLGVCKDICIPLKADFAVELGGGASLADEEAAVDDAFDDLPTEAHEGFRVTGAKVDGDRLVIDAEAPSGAAPDLFVASSAGPVFGTPVPERQGGHTIFRIPLFGALDGNAATLRYTLVAGEDAVDGTVMVER